MKYGTQCGARAVLPVNSGLSATLLYLTVGREDTGKEIPNSGLKATEIYLSNCLNSDPRSNLLQELGLQQVSLLQALFGLELLMCTVTLQKELVQTSRACSNEASPPSISEHLAQWGVSV